MTSFTVSILLFNVLFFFSPSFCTLHNRIQIESLFFKSALPIVPAHAQCTYTFILIHPTTIDWFFFRFFLTFVFNFDDSLFISHFFHSIYVSHTCTRARIHLSLFSHVFSFFHSLIFVLRDVLSICVAVIFSSSFVLVSFKIEKNQKIQNMSTKKGNHTTAKWNRTTLMTTKKKNEFVFGLFLISFDLIVYVFDYINTLVHHINDLLNSCNFKFIN